MPINRSRRQGTTLGSGGVRAVILLATVLGIVGMHGIGSHGAHGSDDADHAAPMAHHSTIQVGAVSDVGAIATERPDGSTFGLLDACCIAILVGLGFALRGLRRHPYGPGRPGRTRRESATPVRPPDRGPPNLAELSILRC